MRLDNFSIKNYRSIIDTGIISLSNLDNITVLAGQNEAGKSAILNALYDFQLGQFSDYSMHFSIKADIQQSVSCTFKIENKIAFFNKLSILSKKRLQPENLVEENILNNKIIGKLEKFTLTLTNIEGEAILSIDENSQRIFYASILDKEVDKENIQNEDGNITQQKEKILSLPSNENNAIANIFSVDHTEISLF